MRNQPAEVRVNDTLTWESSRLDPFYEDFDCPPPQPVYTCMPEWFKNLRGDLTTYLPEGFRNNHTARHCAGFRGLAESAWTIPLPIEITDQQNKLARNILITEMLHGTVWDERDGNGEPVWRLFVMFWPWRARLAKGYRLLVSEHGFDWDPNYKSFMGAPEANHKYNPERRGFGNALTWEQDTDPEQYNYCNVESVIAIRKGHVIPAGRTVFSLHIIKDTK